MVSPIDREPEIIVLPGGDPTSPLARPSPALSPSSGDGAPTARSDGPVRRAEGASSARPVRSGEVSRPRPSPIPTATPTGARSPGREPLSPFVAWSAEAQAPLPLEALGAEREGRGVLVEIITDPERFAARVVEGRGMESTIAGLLGVAVLASAAFALVVRLDLGLLVALGAGLRLALSVVLAVAAAIGPIHAAGVLVAARVPLPRLVAVMLAATAVGAAALAPLGPVVRFLHGHDAEWWGPLSLVGAFVVAAAVASVTLRRLLLALAEEASADSGRGALSEGDLFRVGIVARMALVFLGYTSMLALWGVGAFS